MEDKKNVLELDEARLKQVVGGRDEKDVKKKEKEIPNQNEKPKKDPFGPGKNTP